MNFPVASNYFTLTDITRTHYDFGDPSRQGKFKQQYLRTRVAWVEVLEKGATDTIATYYTYDSHGNVKSLVQRVPGISDKRTDYVYDLVSGKINYVFYQYGKHDQFAHQYKYDSDNRLTDVFTSTDRYIWNREATYYYYQHGPLARVELGAHRSQGVDYYYTLQGWIKGVNQPYANDPDIENMDDNNVGKDAYAYALGYYEGDYKPINASFTPTDTRDQLWPRLAENMNHNGLYNGNISWMVTDLAKIGEVNINRAKGMQAMMYKYDQLHRITKSRSLTGYSAASGFTKPNAAYDETYTYDGNGNILTLDRMNALGQVLHDYDYYYYKNSNKLRGVLPIVRDTVYSAAINSNNKLYRDILVEGTARPTIGTPAELRATRDITIQNNFEAEEGNDFAAYIPEDGPFIYDAIGNLTDDEEEGSKISWTPYGKVRTVKTKNDSVVVKFRYDATGNRIEKRVEKHDTVMVTRYMRDASGNVMTIYKDTTILEQPIYGSTRLGMKVNQVADGTQVLGKRNYELSNHLGNVLTVITDNINMQSDSAWANVVSTSDYYPFGLDMEGRSWKDTTSLSARYGFNGKEKDTNDEWGSTTYDYGFRIYNPTIAKFLSVDPLTKDYPELTTYQFASNTPIQAIDLDGLEAYVVIENDGVGHAFIAVPTADGLIVYSYGRYNGSYTPSLGGLAPLGDGVLIKYIGEEAELYLSERLSMGEGKTTQVFYLPDADQTKVIKYFEDQYKDGEDLPKDSKYYGDGKIIDTYLLIGNSCVSKTCRAIDESESLDGTNAKKALDAGAVVPQTVGVILKNASDNHNVEYDPASKDKVQDVTEKFKNEYGISYE